MQGHLSTGWRKFSQRAECGAGPLLPSEPGQSSSVAYGNERMFPSDPARPHEFVSYDTLER
jgi:hypothetical protein